jgi:hypothetical protein
MTPIAGRWFPPARIHHTCPQQRFIVQHPWREPSALASVLVDGRALKRPVNYALVRIVPPDGAQCVPQDDVSVTLKGLMAKFTDSGFQKYTIALYLDQDGSFSQISTFRGTSVTT